MSDPVITVEVDRDDYGTFARILNKADLGYATGLTYDERLAIRRLVARWETADREQRLFDPAGEPQ